MSLSKVVIPLILAAGAVATAMAFSPPPARASSCSVSSPSGITCRTSSNGSGGGLSWFNVQASGWATGGVSHTIVLTDVSSWTLTVPGQEGSCNASVNCGASCNCTGDSCSCNADQSLGAVFCEWWVLSNGNWELDGYFESCD